LAVTYRRRVGEIAAFDSKAWKQAFRGWYNARWINPDLPPSLFAFADRVTHPATTKLACMGRTTAIVHPLMKLQRSYDQALSQLARALALVAISAVVVGGFGTQAHADSQEELLNRGANIYRERCASCHGAKGEGVADAYAEALTGDATIGELTRVIDETMPEEDPSKCVGPDAAAVAAFIHHDFYSEAAQVRNRPPRIGLARLTGNQLRQSIADLYASFHGQPSVTDDRGVKGIYFDGDRWKNENKKIDRVDPVLDFDFGKESPGEGIKPESFYIYWEGSLKADVTGRYEIIVRSSCSFRMDLGKLGREFIDNHVQSGDKTEFRQSIVLTAGRVYPFKIDFIQRKRKTELPPAKFSLSWVPPHGVEQIVPTQNLIPHAGPPTYSLQTMLPPDDRSYGFERGISVSRQWDESTTTAAIEFVNIATSELWPQYRERHKNDSNENRAQLKGFLKTLAEVAFRGPLDDELMRLYIDGQVDQTEDDAEAIKRVVLVTLKSPRFLYPSIDHDRSVSQRNGNRLAMTLFDSLPSDEWLRRAIEKNELQTVEQVRAAAWRMVNDYRTRAKTREMMYEWLNLTHLGEITKNQESFAGFDSALVGDLRMSLNAFLDNVVWSERSDYRDFFRADWSFTTSRIGDFYGESWKPAETRNGEMARTTGDAKLRRGLLTHPYLMSGLAYHDSTSPIHRGVFLIRYMLGRTLRPPNEAFSPLSPDLHPDLTTRERVALQTSPESCQVCHAKINGLGFALENFDAVGRYREMDRSKPVDSSGNYLNRDDQEIKFQGAAELADYLVESPDAHRAFVSRVFQHFVKQPVSAYGPQKLDELTEKFVSSGYSVRELIVEIAVLTAMTHETPPASKES
jgi:mono/diheme cytochrome c family protein